jgi:hypothetical protein
MYVVLKTRRETDFPKHASEEGNTHIFICPLQSKGSGSMLEDARPELDACKRPRMCASTDCENPLANALTPLAVVFCLCSSASQVIRAWKAGSNFKTIIFKERSKLSSGILNVQKGKERFELGSGLLGQEKGNH